jgi:hypothetical protein
MQRPGGSILRGVRQTVRWRKFSIPVRTRSPRRRLLLWPSSWEGWGISFIAVNQSAYYTNVNVARQQPVPFSHKHHVTDDGIDCRYCHTSVEKSGFAGLPTTHTCMSCHSKLWLNSSMLEPVRVSYATDVAAMDARQRRAGFRLLRPQHSCEQRESAAPPATGRLARCR